MNDRKTISKTYRKKWKKGRISQERISSLLFNSLDGEVARALTFWGQAPSEAACAVYKNVSRISNNNNNKNNNSDNSLDSSRWNKNDDESWRRSTTTMKPQSLHDTDISKSDASTSSTMTSHDAGDANPTSGALKRKAEETLVDLTNKRKRDSSSASSSSFEEKKKRILTILGDNERRRLQHVRKYGQ